MEWFGADKKGLEKIARRRGLSYVLFELVQNAWDTAAKEVKVTLTSVEGRPLVDVVVEDDDPDGFRDLAHAWTIFAESEKKGNPEKRGRFNLGEKLVLAICESAEIISTKGNVRFDDEGRHVGRKRTEKGSIFSGRVKMTRAELGVILAAARELIPPSGVSTWVNGEMLKSRTPAKTFDVVLPTEMADEEGRLHRTARKTAVRVYDALERPADTNEGEDDAHNERDGWIYEMGIPICRTGDPWDVEIMQKVPVSLERNSVSASYLRTLRVSVLNEMHTVLKKEDAAKPAIQDALTDERIKGEAVVTVLTHQFGEKRVTYDPSDPEANHRAVAEGYTVIPPGAFSKGAWNNIRSSGASRPSGKVTPTYHAYSENGEPAKFVPEEEWTGGMRGFATFCSDFAWKLIKRDVQVRFEKGRMTSPFGANYGGGVLTFNYDRMGKAYFERGLTEKHVDLLIHEFAHQFESNHLSVGFYDACTRLGAKAVELALSEPAFYKNHGYRVGE